MSSPILTAEITASLVLGTAQLGMDYGIANHAGRPGAVEAAALVGAALDAGVTTFDTAMAYGDSEAALGQALRDNNATATAQVVTKLPPTLNSEDAPQLAEIVDGCCRRLRVDRLAGVLLHREEQLDLLDGPVGAALSALVEQGVVRKLGVSVYTPQQAQQALHHPLIRHIQWPGSMLDRRFLPLLPLARQRGITVHIRSVLLQGVLVMAPDDLPPHLKVLEPVLEQFHRLCRDYTVTPAAAAIGWLLHAAPGAGVIFGAETARQVRDNLDALQRAGALSEGLWTAMTALPVPQDPCVLNPALWPVSGR